MIDYSKGSRDIWIVRGNVNGHSVYPKQDCNIYEIRGGKGDIYKGGWFGGGWFPGDMWWGEGDNI